ncbi:hypothetical protein KAOT1_05647 [Kordia algicida OT-1]|uniref:Uncharacterized protein n=1 Tax=Kordia algicida OT-1 TaxID=391587 RepID=A9E0I3_9FLAO|nr:hypothetical protein KAOT1_05647 [Kordia algicida OT-1]
MTFTTKNITSKNPITKPPKPQNFILANVLRKD